MTIWEPISKSVIKVLQFAAHELIARNIERTHATVLFDDKS